MFNLMYLHWVFSSSAIVTVPGLPGWLVVWSRIEGIMTSCNSSVGALSAGIVVEITLFGKGLMI